MPAPTFVANPDETTPVFNQKGIFYGSITPRDTSFQKIQASGRTASALDFRFFPAQEMKALWKDIKTAVLAVSVKEVAHA